jgi:hypothetical protein
MGTGYPARCRQCGEKFYAIDGGGFHFELTHCNSCGAEKSVSHSEMGDILSRRIKFCVQRMRQNSPANSNPDPLMAKYVPAAGEPLDDEQYAKEVSRLAGKCPCGGMFELNAPHRCPKCHSRDIEDTGEFIDTID